MNEEISRQETLFEMTDNEHDEFITPERLTESLPKLQALITKICEEEEYDLEDLAYTIADVELLLEQFKSALGLEGDVENIKNCEIEKWRRKIKYQAL